MHMEILYESEFYFKKLLMRKTLNSQTSGFCLNREMLIHFKLTKPSRPQMLARVSILPRREMCVLQYPNATIISKFTAALRKGKPQKQLSAPSAVTREFSNSQSKQDRRLPVKHSPPVLFSGLLSSLIVHFGTQKG